MEWCEEEREWYLNRLIEEKQKEQSEINKTGRK
ncbi:MAG: hypothetical protein K0Q47_161 [Sedimentibacter sp.]|jgi:hypothetical protein|nr:hypothetical protein [Sedimentibacter sp.]